MRLRQHGLGLPFVLALAVAVPSGGAQAQAAYLERFMKICEQIVTEVSPGKPPEAVCECTAQKGLASIASNPQVVSAILQGMQTYHGFTLKAISSMPPEQQQAAIFATLSLGQAYLACVKHAN